MYGGRAIPQSYTLSMERTRVPKRKKGEEAQLSPREEVAVELIAKGQSAQSAQLEAGFSEGFAVRGMSDRIRAAVRVKQEQRLARWELDADDIVANAASIAWDPEASNRDRIQSTRLLADIYGLTKGVTNTLNINIEAAAEATKDLKTKEIIDLVVKSRE